MTSREQTAPDAAGIPVPESASIEPPARRLAALDGRHRISPSRPDWAAATIPEHRKPLPMITRESLARHGTEAAYERLSGKNRAQNDPGWPPEVATLRVRGAEIRRETLSDLEGYLGALTEKVQGNGGVAHRAATPDDAADIVAKMAADNDVRLVVKSKSMATEEIHLNAHLEEQGVEVVETDLGEYIVQLADERPSHIVGPALHKSQAEIGALFNELAGEQVPRGAKDLVAFARERLRTDFHRADMGISGVNFAAADTGTLTLVTNEGNSDMVTSQPRTHVAVMTVEKVIPRFRGHGAIVNLTSIAARTGGGGGAVLYATAKGGLSTFTRGLAKETATSGIRVNAVAPGIIATPFHDRHTPADQLSAMVDGIPMGRPGSPEECVGAVLFLASDALSSYVTGQIIEVNGGQLTP